ncbi:MAG: ribulokinase [Clostridia bacterium]|nr:ribulokinase [Clostridia bacterium]
MKQYSLGIDFGSLSGRAVLLDLKTGEETATAVCEYAHAVMSETLPDGTKLGDNWALQHPQDYLDVLRFAVPDVMHKASVSPDQIVGVGVDFTASTVLPVKNDGTPLCLLKEFEHEPHAYVKMWKHHAAQSYADRINEIAVDYDSSMLSLFGDRVSSEWLIPKVMETLDQAPAVYEAMDHFVEAADWIVWKLCGNLVRNACLSGYKSLWNKKRGYPSEEFFSLLDPRLRHFIDEKLSGPVLPSGVCAGTITEDAAVMTGLAVGTPISVAGADAHSAIPGCGIVEAGHLLIVVGTSACHMLMDTEEKAVPGICGVVEDGMLPGFVGYEAGQSCMGDHFEWFQKACMPSSVVEEAEAIGVSPLALMSEKAKKLKPGESGLLALDFWNGNRSVLDNGDLSGMLLGMTLDTKPEEIYRALVEATGFGTRVIVEQFREYGVPLNKITLCGGIPHKNPFLVQVYADILGMPLFIAPTLQAGARGSAIYGAVAAGVISPEEGVRKLGSAGADVVVHPKRENTVAYDALYKEYRRLYEYFGMGENPVMMTLKKLKK